MKHFAKFTISKSENAFKRHLTISESLTTYSVMLTDINLLRHEPLWWDWDLMF